MKRHHRPRITENQLTDLIRAERPDIDSAEPASDERVDAIVNAIVTATRAQPQQHRDRRPRTWVVGASIGVVAASAGVAVALWPSKPADQPQTISCWSDTEPSARWATDRTSASDDPVKLCAALWINGDFGTGGPPQLTSCVSEQGAIAVIPGGPGVCEDRNLAALDDTTAGPVLDVVAVLDRELVQPLASGCFDEAATVEMVNAAITDLDLTDWEVTQLHAFDESRPCGAVGIDVESSQIQISPRPTGPG